jgi:cytidine deaminase
MSEGERKFKAIVIASDSPDYISPCGACRSLAVCSNVSLAFNAAVDSAT